MVISAVRAVERAARIDAAMRSRLSPTACVAWTSMPVSASRAAMNAVFVSTSCPSSSSVPTATSLNARHRPRRTTRDTSKRTSAAKPRAASIIARTPNVRALRLADALRERARGSRAEPLHEPREALVHRPLQRVLQRLADARRETGGRDRDAHGTGLRDRGHRDEAVARLIDAAEQKAARGRPARAGAPRAPRPAASR